MGEGQSARADEQAEEDAAMLALQVDCRCSDSQAFAGGRLCEKLGSSSTLLGPAEGAVMLQCFANGVRSRPACLSPSSCSSCHCPALRGLKVAKDASRDNACKSVDTGRRTGWKLIL